jgi:hypothetical protein
MKQSVKTTVFIVVAMIGCLISASFGGAISRGLVNSQHQISYADLIAVMLTGVSTLLAIVGVGIAVMAFIGWNTIEKTLEERTKQFLESGLKEGSALNQLLEATAQKVFLNYLKSGMDEHDPVLREIRSILESERYKDVPPIPEVPSTPVTRKRRQPKSQN